MPLLEFIISFLAPPICISCGSEGASLCAQCQKSIIPFGSRCFRCAALSPQSRTCHSCRKPGSPGKVISATVHDGQARELMRIYKYEQQRPAAQSMAELMTKTFTANSGSSCKYLIVPVPTATKRVRQRGFDNGVLLAKALAHGLGMPFAGALTRSGQTRQVGSARTDRLVQMEGVFRVAKPTQVQGRDILLVDDVVTTGATITEASKTLRCAGAKSVDALIFAKRL